MNRRLFASGINFSGGAGFRLRPEHCVHELELSDVLLHGSFFTGSFHAFPLKRFVKRKRCALPSEYIHPAHPITWMI